MAKCDYCESMDREAKAALVEELVKAARDVPEPDDEGFCDSCCARLDLVKVGEAYKWKHLEHCWYAKLQAALAKVHLLKCPVCQPDFVTRRNQKPRYIPPDQKGGDE